MELAAGRRPICAKWAFAWKRNQVGYVARGKAQLGAKGFLQKEGMDFLGTFSPKPVISSIRTIAIAALLRCDWVFNRWDIEPALFRVRLIVRFP